jgi:hypothetical protein
MTVTLKKLASLYYGRSLLRKAPRHELTTMTVTIGVQVKPR